MSEWKDIATAPKDGTSVIVAVPVEWNPGWCIGEAHYRPEVLGDGEGWWWANTTPGEYTATSLAEWHRDPTHWMPLPAPPGSTERTSV